MAAEKLTKKRLIQILIMLCILSCAFLYRTYYPLKQTEPVSVAEWTAKTTEN